MTRLPGRRDHSPTARTAAVRLPLPYSQYTNAGWRRAVRHGCSLCPKRA